MLEDLRRMFTNAVALQTRLWSLTIIQYRVARNFAGSNFLRFLRFSAIDYVCVKTLQLEKTSEHFRRQFRLVVFPKIDNKKFEVEKC